MRRPPPSGHSLRSSTTGEVAADSSEPAYLVGAADALDHLAKDTSTRLLTQYDGWDNARVAAMYNVSEQFAQMQMTGQRVRANGQRKRGSSS